MTTIISERRELGSSGIFVSPIGFGASPLGGEFGKIDVSRQIGRLMPCTQHRVGLRIALKSIACSGLICTTAADITRNIDGVEGLIDRNCENLDVTKRRS